MLDSFHGMDSPYHTGMLGGSLLQSVPLDNVLTFLAAITWTEVDEARPWSPGNPVSTEVVEAQQVKIDALTSITSSNYPTALTSTLDDDELNPLKFGRLGVSYSVNFAQRDATVLGHGANDPGRWRYLAALASLWAKLDNLVIQGQAGNTNEFNGLDTLVAGNNFTSSGTSTANTRSDVAKLIANVASAGQGGTAIVGNAKAQRLLTDAYDGGRTEYGPGPLGGLIPFFDKVPFLRADVDTTSNLTKIYGVNLASIVMFYTSGSRDTLGFNHKSNDDISGAVPLSAATDHIVYGGHALNLTNQSALWAVTAVNVASYT